jgi:hypothetical protein
MAGTRDVLQQRGPSRMSGQTRTGSSLFEDLVWAHWVWQTRSRPHVFPRRPRWARPILAIAARINGGSPHAAGNGAGLMGPASDKAADLEEAYRTAAAEFERREGQIIRAYWCATDASAVVVTEKKTGLRWFPWRVRTTLRLHSATEWVTADAPEIADLLRSFDVLAVRVNRLNAVPRLIAMEWIFSEQRYLLGLLERSGGRPSWRETRAARERHQSEIDRLERYYDAAARRASSIWYFGGMLIGLLAVAATAAVIPLIIKSFVTLDLSSLSARTFYACLASGALGAMVSVIFRMRNVTGMGLYEVGVLLVMMLGAFRPVLGAIFGVLTYFAIESQLLPLTPPTERTQFFYYALFAFVAGFSERFAHVIRDTAEFTAAKALTGAEPPDDAAPSGRVPAPAAEPSPSHRVQASPMRLVLSERNRAGRGE